MFCGNIISGITSGESLGGNVTDDEVGGGKDKNCKSNTLRMASVFFESNTF